MKNSSTASDMDQAALLAITALRSGTQYQAAEIIRRNLTAKAMASQPKTTAEYAAMRLLIGTWDAIAGVARESNKEFRDRLFEKTPVCHMWEALEDGVKAIRADLGKEYAADFEWLYKQNGRWISTNKKSRAYCSAASNGLHAFFG